MPPREDDCWEAGTYGGVMAREAGFRVPRPGELPVWVAVVPVAFVQAVGSTGAEHRQQSGRIGLDALGYGLLFLSALALLGRRRWPVPTLAVTASATFLYSVHGYVLGPSFLAFVVALVAAVVAGKRVAAWIAASSVVVGFVAAAWAFGGEGGGWLINVDEPSVPGTVGVTSWALLILTVAEVVRFRAERAAQLRQVRAEEQRRQASEERLRIARELHDVLAHNISMINVQAGVALHLIDERPEQARTALAAIKTASKEALTEMRSVISLLRQEGDAPPRTPTAGLARLDDLLDQTRATGLKVHLETTGIPETLPAGTDLAAYRIVQESLTNITRHSGADEVTVRIGYGKDDVTIQVEDNGHGPGDNHGGSGIPGMRERAAALGGQLTAGPGREGGFSVSAVLPKGESA